MGDATAKIPALGFFCIYYSMICYHRVKRLSIGENLTLGFEKPYKIGPANQLLSELYHKAGAEFMLVEWNCQYQEASMLDLAGRPHYNRPDKLGNSGDRSKAL
jgi:hypothetical protein